MSGRNRRVLAPVAVRLMDVDEGITELAGIPGYRWAMVYFRRKSFVIGRRLFPLVDGTVSSDMLSSALQEIDAEAKKRYPLYSKAKKGASASPPTVTIAVCTRNRTSLLRECLKSLVAVEDGPIEIMVVDNCPSDDSTKELVREFPTIRYTVCPKPGLNRARNHAIRLAHGEIVAFTDDDARVDRDWARNITQNFNDPLVAVATGITLPAELETEAQLDFEMNISFIRGFELKEFTIKNTSPFLVSQMGAGANMAIRTSLLKEIGLFDERLDGGTPTKSGGDHEFFSRVLTCGYRIVYDPSAIAFHHHRRTADEMTHTMFGYGVGVFSWWTKALFERGELSIIFLAPLILGQYHLKRFFESLSGKEGSLAIGYSWAELRGALVGPFAYFRSVLSADHEQHAGP